MQLTEEQIEKVALDFVKKPGMHGYIEVGDLIDFARALLAAHSAEVQEPVAWMYQSEDPLDGGEWLLSDTKPNRRNVRPLYTHPQPITDAARDELIASVIHLARQQWQGNFVYTPEQVRTKLAEIERLDRAKGE